MKLVSIVGGGLLFLGGYFVGSQHSAKPSSFVEVTTEQSGALPARELTVSPVSYETPRESRSTVDRRVSWEQALRMPPGPRRDAHLVDGLRALAARDVDRAFAEASQLAGARGRLEYFFRPVIEVWAESDPRGCLEWLHESDADEQVVEVFESLYAEAVAERGSDWARNMIAGTIASDSIKSKVAATVADNLCAEGSFSQAAVFLDRVKQVTTVETPLRQLALQWAEYDEPQAAAWLAEHQHELSFGDAIGAFVENKAQHEPEQALAWAEELQNEQLKAEIIGRSLKTWFYQDMASAMEWLSAKVEAGGDFDRTIWQLSTEPQLSRVNPEIALSWAESIGDPQLRVRSLQNILDQWHQSDATSATDYLQNSPYLRPDDRQRLLARVRRH